MLRYGWMTKIGLWRLKHTTYYQAIWLKQSFSGQVVYRAKLNAQLTATYQKLLKNDVQFI